jgi:hypothetical protein
MIKIKEENNKIYLLPESKDKMEESENNSYPVSIRLKIHHHKKYIITAGS